MCGCYLHPDAAALSVSGRRDGLGDAQGAGVAGIDHHGRGVLCLTVPEGTICAVVGASGAGKTTALSAICGVRTLTAGQVKLDGRDVTTVPAHDLVPLGLAPLGLMQMPEGRRVFGRLTVRERLTRWAGTLSGGEQQMLAMGRTLMSRSRTLLMDEPSVGLAPQVVDQVFETIVAGEMVLSGAGSALMNSDAVREAYLG